MVDQTDDFQFIEKWCNYRRYAPLFLTAGVYVSIDPVAM